MVLSVSTNICMIEDLPFFQIINPFSIYLTQTELNPRWLQLTFTQQWTLMLNGYHFNIRFKSGYEHANVDMLSQLSLPNVSEEVSLPGELVFLLDVLQSSLITVPTIRAWNDKNPTLSHVRELQNNWLVATIAKVIRCEVILDPPL